jgi:hypothetical protein
MAESYNPILEIKDLGRQGLLQKPPVPEAGVALVFSGDGRPLLTVMQGEKTITWGEARWGYNKLYRVDMTEHPLSFQCDVPCQGDAYQFHAEVTFRCSVLNPQAIVQRNITDVAQWIKSSIEETMRDISRQYDVKDSGNAESPMRFAVNQAISELGFNLSNFTLKLSLEQEVLDWVKTDKRIKEDLHREQVQQDLERQRMNFALEQEKQRVEQNRQRIEQQQQLEQELKVKELEARLKQQQLEQELAQKQAEFELKIMEQKTIFYSSMLQTGNLQLLALQLAQNPGDVQAILQALNQQKQIEREHHIKVLQTLLDADAIEGWQLTEVSKRALKELMGTAEPSLPSAPSVPDNDRGQVQSESEPIWDKDEDE